MEIDQVLALFPHLVCHSRKLFSLANAGGNREPTDAALDDAVVKQRNEKPIGSFSRN